MLITLTVKPLLGIAVIAALGLAAQPAAAQQTLYVSNQGNNTIEQYTPPSSTGSVFSSSGVSGPEGLAFDSAGNLYLASSTSNTIVKYAFNGTTLSTTGTTFATGLGNPNGLAFDPLGNLYVANTGTNTIAKITPGGAVSQFANSGLSTPRGLAFFGGNLYAANQGNNTIESFNAAGAGTQFNTSGTLSAPSGLAFDNAGNLYVSNFSNNTIERFTSGGVGTQFNTSGNLQNPNGLAFDSAGNLFVANFNLANTGYSIESFNGSGVGTQFTNSGLSQPTLIAFSNVAAATPAAASPEPSSWAALAFTVLGALGLMRNARRRRHPTPAA